MADGNRIALGSAQFGRRYGVANRLGAPEQQEVARIVSRARAACVDTIDTAMSYGNSEAMLGSAGVTGLRVVTKLPPIPVGASGIEAWVRQQVRQSTARLHLSALHGLLLHQPSDAVGHALAARELRTTLAALKTEGVVVRVGASIYHPVELDALTHAMPLDLVQAPYSVVDRRLATSGWLARLREAGTEIHVRSVFLQGLLLLDETDMPSQFATFAGTFMKWRAWLRDNRISALAGALGFALANPAVDRVVVGVESLAQLDGILAHASAAIGDVPADLETGDLSLINPATWSRA